jgi:tetratricopeptide (TPR) repeat protein
MTSVPQLLGLALQHYRKGEWPQAEQLYRRVLQVDPSQPEALRILALVACRTGRGEEAITCLRAVLKLRPMWADAHNDLGMVFISQGRLVEAATSFREAVRLQPNLAAAHNNLGNTLRELSEPAEAAASLREAIRLAPGYAEAHYNLGLALAAQCLPYEALCSFQQAARLKPDYAEAHMEIGRSLTGLTRYRGAAASFEQVLRLEPGNAQARAELERARAGDTQITAPAAGSQGASRLDADYLKAAVRIEDVPSGSDPCDAVGSNEGKSYGPATAVEVPNDVGPDIRPPEQIDDAETTWEQTLHLNCDYARLHYYLASVLEKQGRSESALAHYEEVMRLEPDHPKTLVRIQTIQRARRRLDNGIDACNQTNRVRSGDESIRNLLVRAMSQNNRHTAPKIEKTYERCEQWWDHSESQGRCARPVAAQAGDRAALDVYFGFLACTSGNATAPTALESMPEEAEPTGEVHADACAP